MNIGQSEIPGFVLLYFSCSIAAAGGIGGGGLNVPILLIIMKYSYHDAVILSLCTVLGKLSLYNKNTVFYNKLYFTIR